MTSFRFFGLKNQLNRVKTSVCLTILLLLTLFTLGLRADEVENQAVQEEIAEEAAAANYQVKVKNEAELIGYMQITQKIVSTPRLIEYLNEVFKDHLIVSEALQKKYGWSARIKGLSEPQILFLLKSLPNYHTLEALLNEYMEKIINFTDNDPLREDFVGKLKEQFKSILDNGKIVTRLKKLNDPSRTLTIGYSSGKLGFTQASIHFNEYFQTTDPNTGAVTEYPVEDLKQIIIESLRNAKKSISINIFEFNLMEIVDAIEDALKRGVQIRVGVDRNTTRLAQENIDVLNRLISFHRTKYRGLFKLTLVDSTGLNHQKVVNIDAGTSNAKTIFVSGNFTQSCLGAEGDAKSIPPEFRPKKSKPNANHLTVYASPLASVLVDHELDKTLDQKLRGQRAYPISGSYSFLGQQFEGFEKPSKISITFSPNGGMGEVSNTIFRPMILRARGQMFLWQFVASAPILNETIVEAARKNPTRFDFRGLFDPPFAMQNWSTSLIISGLQRDPDSKIYSVNPNSPMRKILGTERFEKLQSNIRLNTRLYGEFHETVQMPTGEIPVKMTVKMHNKIMVFPRISLAVIGTSFNVSASAEGNQEQIMTIEHHPIVKITEGAFLYQHQIANTTVLKLSERRNSYNDIPNIPKPNLELPKSREKEIDRVMRSASITPDVGDVDKETDTDLVSAQVIRAHSRLSNDKCIRHFTIKNR